MMLLENVFFLNVDKDYAIWENYYLLLEVCVCVCGDVCKITYSGGKE